MKNFCSKCLIFLKKLAIFIIAITVVIGILAAFYISADFIFKGVIPSFIARAVLLNFIVFSLIIYLVFRFAIRPNELLEKAQQDIEKSIKKSEETKLNSQERLSETQKRMENIEEEITEIYKNSELNAQQAGERIIEDAHKIAANAKESIDKTIQNNKFLLKHDIIKRTSNALIEIAKSNIVEELNRNPQLHDKLIDESIETIVLNEQIEGV